MGPFRGPYRGSPLRDPCWWAVTTEVAAHWEEVLMGPFRGGTHRAVLEEIEIHVHVLIHSPRPEPGQSLYFKKIIHKEISLNSY